MKKPTKKGILKSFILLFFVIVGSVLIWRSIWEVSEEYLSLSVSFLLGVIILLGVGIYSKRFLIEHL